MRYIFLHRHLPFLPFVLACCLMAGCDGSAQQGPPPSSVTYMVVEARQTPLILETELPGRTSAFNISEVRPQISGIIQERLFEQGDSVVQGQPLYQIDPALYQAAVDSAQASLDRAKANAQTSGLLVNRYSKLTGTNAISKQDYDDAVAANNQAKADVSYAQAALDTAKINLGYTKITAPISGRIGKSEVTAGALVTQNQAQPLAVIQQLDPIYVDVTQSNTDMLRLRQAYANGFLVSSGENAAKARLLLPDGSVYSMRDENGLFKPVEGQLLFSEVSVEPTTGSVSIRAVFPNPDGLLLPGMFVRAVVEEGARPGAILVPQRAVSSDNKGRPVVLKLVKNATIQDQDGIYNVQSAVISTDRDIDGQWLVIDGLDEGDRIILDGKLKVQAGRPVRGVLPSPATAGQTAPQDPAAAGSGKQ